MTDFFISFNKADRQWAEWIAWELEEAGYSVIIQCWDFPPGCNFVLKMHEAAIAAERTIGVLSTDFLNSSFTQPEWAAAFSKDPTGKKRKLLLIRVQDCQPEDLLAAINYLDLVGLDEERAREKILAAARGDRLKPNSPPAFPPVQPASSKICLAYELVRMGVSPVPHPEFYKSNKPKKVDNSVKVIMHSPNLGEVCGNEYKWSNQQLSEWRNKSEFSGANALGYYMDLEIRQINENPLLEIRPIKADYNSWFEAPLNIEASTPSIHRYIFNIYIDQNNRGFHLFRLWGDEKRRHPICTWVFDR